MKLGGGMWFLDSGCSRHMTGDKRKFLALELKDRGKVTLGDNTTCRVLGSGSIKLSRFITLEKVLYVDNLKHNLLSISQLCDKGLSVCFTTDKCILTLHENLELIGVRIISKSLLLVFLSIQITKVLNSPKASLLNFKNFTQVNLLKSSTITRQ